ncbi:MAG TPA: endonuclease/exonuclease/phosphatase family protein [Myxococcales bacterium]|nr:endonuclease/exonuclease/phosphatase family protein [Myxococcales bacterium]
MADGALFGVMTRNLYLGADLAPVLRARSEREFVAATTAGWAMVRKNDFRVRAEGLAAEIAACGPALLGLQEACIWRTQAAPGGPSGMAWDYVEDLAAALLGLGLAYAKVAQVELFDFQAPTLDGEEVRMTDRGVILARQDVEVANAAGALYTELMPLRVGGRTLPLRRGHAAIDAKVGGAWVRFVSTHLEGFDAGVRDRQAAELAAQLAEETRPVILVGDLNSRPGEGGAAVLTRAGFRDAWTWPGGLTCCFAEDLGLPGGSFSERIDYVLTRGPLEVRRALVTGQDPALRRSGLWPSDHAGVFAELRIVR